jgi:hypothetical protein
MSDEPNPEEDAYEPAPIAEPKYADEAARLHAISAAEDIESRREILLGQIAVARSKLYAAEAADDAVLVATLRERIAKLTSERDEL